MPLSRERIAERIADFVQPGSVVNLGIGMPTLVANYIGDEKQVLIQSENGLLGMGAFPTAEQVDPDLINAGKQTVTAVKGASFFSSAESFAMIRGGHVDITVLGAMEVSCEGDIANWMIPNKMVKGMGGAMDLVAGAKKVVVAMTHTNKKGEPKILPACRLPLTGKKCVDIIVSDYGYIKVDPSEGLVLMEHAADLSPEQVAQATGAPLKIHPQVRALAL